MNNNFYFKNNNNKNNKRYLKSIINFKDIFIILSLWYLIIFTTNIINQIEFCLYSPQLENILNYLIIIAARLIFTSLALFYFVSLYNLSLNELKIKFKINFLSLLQILFIILFFAILNIILINIPLSIKSIFSSKFTPLYKIASIDNFVNSIFTAIFIFIGNFIIVLAEIFVLINIFQPIINQYLGKNISIFISAFLYPLLMMKFDNIIFIQYFFLGLIYFTLYKKFKNITVPSLLGAAIYTVFILYIYGWNLF